MFADADLLPLSALQHYIYCPRQCTLIHLEQQWTGNRFTAEYNKKKCDACSLLETCMPGKHQSVSAYLKEAIE